MVAPASYREDKLTPAFFEEQHHLWVLADYGFQSPPDIAWLEETRQITLTTAKLRNAREPYPAWFGCLMRRLRRRIETAFGVITVVFNLESPGARSLSGLLCRISTTVLAYNLSFLTNIELAALETRN
jgi:Transposase DDE domain